MKENTEEKQFLNIKFNKFTIKSDGKFNFILEETKDKGKKNWYYSNLTSLLNAIPNKMMLKSESMSIWELTCELDKLGKDIKELTKVLTTNAK